MIVSELLTKLGYVVDESGIKKADSMIADFSKKALAVGAVATAAVAAGVAAIGLNAITSAAQMESLEAEFAVMLGSAEKAAKLVADIQKMAATTPFGTKDLTKNTKLLINFGVAEEKVLGILQMIGDTAGTDKEKMAGLALAFGQITAKTKLMGDDLRQLVERGFNPLQEISERTGVSYADLHKKMSKGLISSKDVEESFRAATSEGGKFFKNMETQSKLTVGIWSTLKDTFQLASIELGKKLLPTVNLLIKALQKVADGPLIPFLENVLAPAINSIAKSIESVVNWVEKLNESTSSFGSQFGFVASMMENIKSIFGSVVAFASDLINSLMPSFLSVATSIKDIWETLLGSISLIVSNLMPKYLLMVQAVWKVITEISAEFFKLIQDILPDVIIFIEKLFVVVGDAFVVIAKLFTMLKPLLMTVLKILFNIAGFLFKVILSIGTFIGSVLEGIVTAVEFVTMVVDKFLDALVKAGAFLSKIFGINEIGVNATVDKIDDSMKKIKVAGDDLGVDTKSLEGFRMGQGGTKITNINNTIEMPITVPEGTDKTQAKRTGRAVREAAESIFGLELQKVILTTV